MVILVVVFTFDPKRLKIYGTNAYSMRLCRQPAAYFVCYWRIPLECTRKTKDINRSCGCQNAKKEKLHVNKINTVHSRKLPLC